MINKKAPHKQHNKNMLRYRTGRK